jgi:hypothetical protein
MTNNEDQGNCHLKQNNRNVESPENRRGLHLLLGKVEKLTQENNYTIFMQ